MSWKSVYLLAVLCLICEMTLVRGSTRGRCDYKADVVIMVPAHYQKNTQNSVLDFAPVEDFLLNFVNFLDIGESTFNIGLVVFNRLPVILSDLRPFNDRKQINTRISLMANTWPYPKELGGRIKVHRAIDAMTDMFLSQSRDINDSRGPMDATWAVKSRDINNNTTEPMAATEPVKRIGILFVNRYLGNTKLVMEAVQRAKNVGVVMYVIATRVPEDLAETVQQIASDRCKLFDVKYFGQETVEKTLAHIGNDVCNVAGNLTEEEIPENKTCPNGASYMPPPLDVTVVCQDIDILFPDPFNCAYFFKCNKTGSPHRMRCIHGDVFDPETQACNYREAVSCFSQIQCPLADGLFPYPGDCTKFLNCYRGLTYTQRCPSGLYFDGAKQRCVTMETTACKV